MTFKGIRVKLVALVLIFSLAIFFGANYYINHYRLDNSLSEDLMAVEGITEVEIDARAQVREIVLTLTEIDNLRSTYREVTKLLDEKIGSEDYIIILNAPEAQDLKEVYNRLHLVVYETIITGEFTKLASQLKIFEEEFDLKMSEVNIDHEYIYLRLDNGSDSLYKVIARNIENGGGADG